MEADRRDGNRRPGLRLLPTDAAVTADGPIVVYRDRSDDEIRDISVSRLIDGKWSDPVPVHRDNWKIQACPVNGPAIDARGRDVVVAWFSAVGNQPKAFAAFSKDAGRSFGPPIRLDGGVTLGRVDVVLLPDGSAIAGYIEQVEQRSQFRFRRIHGDGRAEAPSPWLASSRGAPAATRGSPSTAAS